MDIYELTCIRLGTLPMARIIYGIRGWIAIDDYYNVSYQGHERELSRPGQLRPTGQPRYSKRLHYCMTPGPGINTESGDAVREESNPECELAIMKILHCRSRVGSCPGFRHTTNLTALSITFYLPVYRAR